LPNARRSACSGCDGQIRKTLGIVIAGLLVLATGLVLILLGQSTLQGRAHEKAAISAVFAQRYSGASVSILAMDEGPSNQRCYSVELTNPDGDRVIRKNIAVNGDDDGGTWSFAKEHESLQSCINAYWRG
jgi:hypothetical protein